MLTLTDNAVQVIRDLTAQSSSSQETGIRIASQADQAGSLVLSISDGPAATDQVIEVEGARVFLDPVAADALDDKSLDANVDQQGSPSFRLSQQTTG
ncbi:Fe-S cluster assembly iron-binding protein IscA [Thermocatellispora tengchongensis]|uniref:Fe-S cluster assembly iron-binding protein IscA n=1 Tax=Thermocatellispora tengchongensis TaxID=1073253 RepID=A0A840P1W3_9ACTN|nr:Fe-S cluster assembly protein HesB [Thermocatellispora tengchongensis]MBB5131923.1 Fe-S cluster assembly iron-binding protein IscA [Thermocatellispora tengchongensis]